MSKNGPVLLVLMGSFNPPHMAHLRTLEMAKDFLVRQSQRVIGGVMSPVHNDYKKHKKSLIDYQDRRAMVELATQNTWIKCSVWEGKQSSWTPTRQTLEALQEQARVEYNEPNLVAKLVCGADLLESFSVPDLWKWEDIDKILGNHGVLLCRRQGSNPDQFIFKHDLCNKHSSNIKIIYEPVNNDVSSTVLRTLAARNCSLRFLTTDSVCDFIAERKLYCSDS